MEKDSGCVCCSNTSRQVDSKPSPSLVPEGSTSHSGLFIKIMVKKTGVSQADREGLKSRACTQDFLSFLICAFFFLAPVWRRLGLLLTKDNLAFFCGSAKCGDLPETSFLGSSF